MIEWVELTLASTVVNWAGSFKQFIYAPIYIQTLQDTLSESYKRNTGQIFSLHSLSLYFDPVA